MRDVELGSRSDLEALKRSGRGKVITLMVLLALALAAAGWYFFGKRQGTGNPEDPAKVIVVGTTRGYSVALDNVGFEAAEGTFDAWELKAKEEIPELEVTGIEAIMAVADRFGYGYVIFEQPGELDFSALEIEEIPDFPDHVRFAVLSAGDLAFPHVMTVNPEPSEVLRGSSVVLLQALFAQPLLAETLLANDNPSIETIQLRDRVRDAVDQLEKVPHAEKMASNVVRGVREQLEDEERAEPRPKLVGETLESGSSFPLANGQILTISRGFEVVSRDAVRADLALDNVERIWLGDPGADASSRTRCDALHGGEISIHDSPHYWMAADGAALLTQTLSDGLSLWTLDANEPGCGFSLRGKVPAPSPGLDKTAEPAGHGQVARVGSIGTRGVVIVVTAGSDDELMLGMLDDVRLSSVAWLSERHLVAVGEDLDGSSLYFFDTQTPLTVLRLRSTVFENAEVLHEVAVGKRGQTPVIVVSAGHDPRRVYRLDLPMALPPLFSSPPALFSSDLLDLARDSTLSRADRGLPSIVELDPNGFVSATLTHEGRARSLTVSADGAWAAFSMRGEFYDPSEPGDAEIVAVPTQGGTITVLTRNALRDRDPRLTPDGSHVVFQTRVEIPRTDWVVSSPRVAAVGGSGS